MYLCLFEDETVEHLNPLVRTRAVYDLRLGIRTVLENTRAAFGDPPLLLHTRRHVAAVTARMHPGADALVGHIPEGLGVLFVNGRYVAEAGPLLERLQGAARAAEPARVFVQGSDVVAAWVPEAGKARLTGEVVTRETFADLPEEPVEGAVLLARLWHLLDARDAALRRDFAALTKGYRIYERPGADIREGARLVHGEQVYVAPGAVVHPGAILNAEDGPVYVDAQAVVMEQAVVRGPAYIGPHSQVRVGALLDGCVLGPWSKVGGEVYHSIIDGYSNKAHSGFLGDAYLGRWCNIGAGTNNSNLRNDYGPVRLYNERLGTYETTERQFLGLFLADHAKCGIDTMFNTGTVVGVACNLYGAGYHPTYLPSFIWGSPQDRYTTYRLPKALRVAETVMARRQVPFTDIDRELLTTVFDQTEAARAAFLA
ncbi:MAG: hypothetical protein KatS3mg043_2064 [Rhodothermaceae bacterium]|nr:MAG: hypothetical protein KatS3mg043_2064 [Rhodothermaceae bacterium]